MLSSQGKPFSTYIAGPMTGKKNHNFPAFNRAAADLRKMGWIVINPAEGNWNKKRDQPWEFYMCHDIAKMVMCDAIHCLPGWRKSKGARLEVHIARRLKKPILDYRTRQYLYPFHG